MARATEHAQPRFLLKLLSAEFTERPWQNMAMDILTLRRAEAADAGAVSALIASVMHYMTARPDGQGAETFKASLAPAAIAGYIAGPAYHYQVALLRETLVGVVALREHCHIFHLFVAPAFHHRGFGRQLWHSARAASSAAGHAGDITVNSSVYAAPMYRRFGFADAGPRMEHSGIVYIPMRRSPG
jgi:ribosomal protein S18 acetylase RimI-like enzyme